MRPGEAIERAAARLADAALVAYPTETVWGLGGDAASATAVARLRRWKGRADDAPISVLVEDAEAARRQGFELAEPALRLAAAFWPGPLTLVVPGRARLARGIARADGGVGLRCSSHPLVRALLRSAAARGTGPITATSLNRSGAPAARTRDEAKALCGGDAESPALLEVEGAEAGGDAPSSVVDATVGPPRLLREGALGFDALAAQAEISR